MRKSLLIILALAFIIAMPMVESAFAATVPLRTVQCQITDAANPKTLWLGWPSTIGRLSAKTCTLTLLGDHVVLTLPGTTTQTTYQLANFSPAIQATASTPVPTTGATHVTLTFKNHQPYLTEGGAESYSIQSWTPKADGTTITVINGLNSYRLTLTLIQ